MVTSTLVQTPPGVSSFDDGVHHFEWAMNTLWLRDLIRGSESRFTMLAEDSFSGVWSSQVDRIVFGGIRRGARQSICT